MAPDEAEPVSRSTKELSFSTKSCMKNQMCLFVSIYIDIDIIAHLWFVALIIIIKKNKL